jgi:hypothetical protein
MDTRLHELQAEIRSIESIIDSLPDNLRVQAEEELENLYLKIESIKHSHLADSANLELIA